VSVFVCVCVCGARDKIVIGSCMVPAPECVLMYRCEKVFVCEFQDKIS
jgi:hypothetical protein